MANTPSAIRRLLLTGGFIVAAVAAPVIAGGFTPEPGVSLAQCSSGEENDVFTSTCTPFLVPTKSPLFTTNAANPDIPEIDGIPCTGGDSGACIGLAENAEAAGPPAVPRSTISSSP
jgi:hypothetical protein